MPQAPDPITSPPPLPWQPYDAAAPEESESQVDPESVYDANAEAPYNGNPWKKLADGGAIDSSGRSVGTWPGNGTSSDGGWRNV
jgi:hypothetical protein